jgi:hypothetical protein
MIGIVLDIFLCETSHNWKFQSQWLSQSRRDAAPTAKNKTIILARESFLTLTFAGAKKQWNPCNPCQKRGLDFRWLAARHHSRLI